MATESQAGLTYRDLLTFPKDGFRRELLDGELIVTAAPGGRHQAVVVALGARLLAFAEQYGGKVSVAPRHVFFTDRTVLEPDVTFVKEENLARVEEPFIRGAPDIVVEVSSPTLRRSELIRKREVYERFGVRECWYVDFDAEHVEVHRLQEGRYGPPDVLSAARSLSSPLLPGLTVPIDELLVAWGAGA